MIAAAYDLRIQRGSNAPVVIRLKAQAADGTRTVLDLTGYTVELDISWRGGSITKSTVGGGLTVDLPSGAITWTPTTAETAALPSGGLSTYTYWLTAPGGEKDAYLTGQIIGEG